MPASSTTWTRLLTLLAVLFAVVSTANAVNKGGDATVFFEGGRRFLAGEPLYAGSSAADGFIGPPFQAAFFAPFAAVASVSPLAGKLLWHTLNLVCLGLGVLWSLQAADAMRRARGLPDRAYLPMLFAPLVAILLPLLTNFEHQNMNALLLALIAAATWHVTLGSAIVAGALVGTATALKAFPALLIPYFLITRQWVAAATAVLSAAVLSIALPFVAYGPAGFADMAATFWRLGNSGWPVRGNNQSLVAALDRLTSGHMAVDLDRAGVRLAGDNPLAATLAIAIGVVLLATLFLVLARRTPRASRALPGIAAATVLAVLLSPIAWDHYWTMMFPAYLVLFDARDGARGRVSLVFFWIAAVLTTGLSPLTLGGRGFDVARDWSIFTAAGLIVFAGVVQVLASRDAKGVRDRALSD